MQKKYIRLFTFILAFFIFLNTGASASEDKKIKFADPGWDSAKFHNALAGYIAKNVFGYSYVEIPGSGSILHEGLIKGELDINMEVWTDNIVGYNDDVKSGKLTEIGVNFDDNRQGVYVPRYVIEGDKERGIEALAPDLKHVKDLNKYWEIFTDEEDPSKGRVYGALPGWDVDTILYNKYKHYSLDENFNYFRPGSDAAMNTAITSAYDRGEPIAAYYWEPTWIMGQYDFILLEDEPYTNVEDYDAGKTSFPDLRITIAGSNSFYNNEENKDFVRFLENYKTSSALSSQALAHMQDTGDDYDKTAQWFIKENKDLIDSWLTNEEIELLNKSLGLEAGKGKNILKEFPLVLPINLEKIDKSIRDFSTRHDKFFGAIKGFLAGLVNNIHKVLDFIPWFILIILVFFAGWKTNSKMVTGLLYSLALFSIGLFGLWDMMLETLSIILASVVISLILGFPLGILLSMSDRANKIARPILDALQTMPVFVYLIPALLFFGLGKPPAVIATTIYAIVPIIRLTALGINQIDEEIIEASEAFGATRLQTLVKVQIPQALPTIMTGVNQTLMMAMSMVVTTSMIGATGLGMEVLISVNRIEIGRGLISGTSVVILAVILDRITQGFIQRTEEKVDKYE